MNNQAKTKMRYLPVALGIVVPLVLLLALAAANLWVAQADPMAQTIAPYSEQWRFGVGVDGRYGHLSDFAVEQLGAGWYADWSTNLNPLHPGGMEYVQVISVKDTLYPPDWASLAQKIANNPGAVWVVGNEPDCIWEDCNNRTPDAYATIYHDVYGFIKGQDPTAQVAIASVVEGTPLRMLYLTKIWDSYQQQYSDTMPVDIFNMHVHIIKEGHSWAPAGIGIPPGISPEEEGAAQQYAIADNDSLAIFMDQVMRYRQWMRDRGQQNKPLVITEYGVLYPPEYPFGFTVDRVNAYMKNTFNFMLYTKNPALGYPADDYRLVQRWLWFSVNSHPYDKDAGQGWNGALFDWQTHEMTPFGLNFMHYRQGLNRATPTPSTTPYPGWFQREAEGGSLFTPVATVADNTVSACYYLDSSVGQPGGRTTFGAYLPAGNYQLWGRVRAPSDVSNSFYVWADSEQAPTNLDQYTWYIPVSSEWSWQPVSYGWGNPQQVFTLTSDSHTFVFQVREGGVQLDAVQIGLVGTSPPTDTVRCVPPATATATPTSTPTPTPTLTRTPMSSGPAYIRGQVTYEGRGTPPAANWSRTLHVGVHLPGDSIPAYKFDALPDASGAFTVGGVLTGTYDVSARNDHSLRNLWLNFFADAGVNQINLDTLREGDASGDNFVDISDFSLLRSAFFTSNGDPGFDALADFNEDSFIDISDFSLLRSNFFQGGDILLNAGTVQVQGQGPKVPSASPVGIYFSPGAQTVNTGQLGFTADVWVNPAGQEIDAAQAEVTFDSSLMDAVSVVCNGSYFDTTYQLVASGNVRVACTLKIGQTPPTTTLRVATITFNAKTSPGTTLLTFGGFTKVTGPGVSQGYPLNKQSGSVTVQAPSPTPTATNTPVSVVRTFSGHVYEGDTPQPVEGGTVQLYGSNSAGNIGAWLGTVTTLPDGSFNMLNTSNYVYYNIYLPAESWVDYTFRHASSASGGNVLHPYWIQFTSPSAGTYAGNDFFVNFNGSTSTPTATTSPGTTPTPTETPTPTPTNTPGTGTSQVCVEAFNDLDANSQRGGGEDLLNGVLAELLDLNYQLLDSYTTDGSEPYCFPGRGDGTYLLRFAPPNGFSSTTASLWGVAVQGGGSLTVSYGALSGPTPSPTPGGGRISGVVYNDANKNQFLDQGEAMLHGAHIHLQDGGGQNLADYWTGSDGLFHFDSLVNGTYRLVEDDPPGFLSSTQNTLVVGVVSQLPITVDFGDYEPARPFDMYLPMLRKPEGNVTEFRGARPLLRWGS